MISVNSVLVKIRLPAPIKAILNFICLYLLSQLSFIVVYRFFKKDAHEIETPFSKMQ